MSSCIAITRKGRQCSKRPNHSGYCRQHHRMRDNNVPINVISTVSNIRNGMRENAINRNANSELYTASVTPTGTFTISGNINVNENLNIREITDLSVINRIGTALLSVVASFGSSTILRNGNVDEITNRLDATTISDNNYTQIGGLKKIKITPLYPNENCNVCLERCIEDEKVTTFCCRRIFCVNCLSKSIEAQKRCPMCRAHDPVCF